MSPGIIFVENNVFKWYHVYGSKIPYLKKKRNKPLIFFNFIWEFHCLTKYTQHSHININSKEIVSLICHNLI